MSSNGTHRDLLARALEVVEPDHVAKPGSLSNLLTRLCAARGYRRERAELDTHSDALRKMLGRSFRAEGPARHGEPK